MNFADLVFWQHLGSALAVAFALRLLIRRALAPPARPRLDQFLLAGVDLYLLARLSLLTLGIFLVVAALTYAGFFWMHQEGLTHRSRRARLGLLIVVLLLPLLWFKYAPFLAQVGGLTIRSDLLPATIPVGISFYTFQKIALLVDSYRGDRPRLRPLEFTNFAAFFPQIVAGPIERQHDLLPQMQRFAFRWQRRDIAAGVAWIVLGLFYKCAIADNLALSFQRDPPPGAWAIWLANLTFGLLIYFDFAGYSMVALGLARCLGVRLTLNFRSPYLARNLVDFWRRWHVTLSQWFRDYVYLPLGGNRTRWWAVNLLVVFLVSGLWHGAGWNFLVWGGLHGVGCLLSHRWGVRTMPGVLAWSLTMLVTFLAWMAFYETRLDQLWHKFQVLLSPGAYAPSYLAGIYNLASLGAGLTHGATLALAAAVIWAEARSVRGPTGELYRLFRTPAGQVVVVILTVLLAPGTSNEFIYFAF